MINFGIRNLKIFFKDRASVFFSLLAVFIIIGLYAFFLGDAWLSGFEGMDGAKYLMDSWIMAGLLAVVSVTTTMGAFESIVTDKNKKIIKDFTASPIRNRSIVGGYIISAFLVGIIMSLLTLILAEVYIIANGGEMMNASVFAKILGLIVLSTVCNASLVLFIVSFFKSTNAFATASTVIGTTIGFITGIYMPIGMLPEGVQWLVRIFPVSHSASLFRQVMMEEPISTTFAGAPTEVVANFEETMGVVIIFGDTQVTPIVSISICIVSAVVFYGLSIMNLSRKRK